MIIEKKKILSWVIFPTKEQLKPSLNKVYIQSDYALTLFTHIRKKTTTYLIDLRPPSAERLRSYSKKLRQNIHRAQRAGILIERDQNPAAVIRLFQPIAEQKQLNSINLSNFKHKEHLLITRAVHPKHGVLAAHAYQLDAATSKVVGVYNASAFRQYDDDQHLQYLCGQANSLLYHEDFTHFQERGFKTYDFGGYGGNAPGADYFKDRFGGQIVTQYNYYPVWYYWVRRLRTASK